MATNIADDLFEKMVKDLAALNQEMSSQLDRHQELIQRAAAMLPMIEETRGRLAKQRDAVRAEYIVRGLPLTPELKDRSMQ